MAVRRVRTPIRRFTSRFTSRGWRRVRRDSCQTWAFRAECSGEEVHGGLSIIIGLQWNCV
ncbi:hypothetical protein UK23_05625 [Lentzea aerocolonigenes]|uniref:Uncharacterized protein n=1 Tax=Lentzea aerocolonigenes TaxID=68170 RepID=A0A0F0H8F2_LENAE|nr:hypothetical protein UK23_05625 [Lentzea aerocolonigenes]